ncbi:hypothetical protein ATZ33_00075 [Enterococcus silesiacus]|uniref:Malonyl CoA-acyl carrier protein transacylase n=1 Tax=Enterococcus silesiacus TaxID=332949 RepID=A0A0S3K6C5_9ENTE|nr:ACP S-malonyltransferase [Enterococcus silesiacus]ALR99835.1 hypothetical protein ATZ33_00075 [Enterococcus silesiacus]OJG92864.1 hypothetical protein RV15_GL002809 [Enterococcus silesiacus]
MNYGLLFPGQGSQYTRMNQLAQCDKKIVDSLLEEASDILNLDLKKELSEKTMKELTQSEIAQPAIVVLSHALFLDFMQRTQQKPTVLLGHSLGEISAYLASESLTFSEAVAFAQNRGKLMASTDDELKGSASLVVDILPELLEELIRECNSTENLMISGYNSEKQSIVVGQEEELEQLEKLVESQGGQIIPFRMIPMKEARPFHSPFVTMKLDKLREIVETLTVAQPKVTVYSTVSGELVSNEKEIKANLIKQLVSPVLWLQGLKKVSKMDVSYLIDIGPNKIMRNLVFENSFKISSLAYDDIEDNKKIRELLTKEERTVEQWTE